MARNKKDLVFSANSLQTYQDCHRRFQLRYLHELKWPAVESEPVLQSELFLTNGRRFHEMIQRDVLGIPVPEPSVDQDPELAAWWHNYQMHMPVPMDETLYAEKTLVGSLRDRILVATYDLIAKRADGQYTIYDWKTWRQPKPLEWVKNQLQSRVYPMLLIQAGASLNEGNPIAPSAIEMRYWYAQAPEASVAFTYSAAQYDADQKFVQQMVDDIDELGEQAFEKTPDLKKCRYCPYRSYCDRGSEAGAFEEFEEESISIAESLLGDLDDYETIAF